MFRTVAPKLDFEKKQNLNSWGFSFNFSLGGVSLPFSWCVQQDFQIDQVVALDYCDPDLRSEQCKSLLFVKFRSKNREKEQTMVCIYDFWKNQLKIQEQNF